MNLIEQLGGYCQAKKCAESGLHNTQKINEALLGYRRANNIFEPDDYIIHDGELKVFAMWSKSVNGCAYIGYAYADDGEMAHANEFRHATDKEISAGRKL